MSDGYKDYDITVRPWRASGGSSVHDELITFRARTAYEAIKQLYDAKEYDFAEFRIVDVAWREDARSSRAAASDLKCAECGSPAEFIVNRIALCARHRKKA
jgi:hypothetical protein